MSKLTLISSATASGSASVSFTSGIDSTYNEYVFFFVDIHCNTDSQNFGFQVNASGQTGFNEVITSTYFYALHDEAGSTTSLAYDTSRDQAQGTSYNVLFGNTGNGADECGAGELHLFNPSSTTYVKHFYATTQDYNSSDYTFNSFAAGYVNTTSAITEIDFKMMTSGTFDGNIYMFGAS